MLRKNVASQFIHFAGIKTADGTALTGATFAYRRSIDGTFAAGGGTITEDTGTGFYKVALAQADTNGNDLAFFFTATGAIPICINVLTTAADPSDGVRLGLTALPNAAAAASGGLIINGTNTGTVDLAALTVTGVTTHTGATVHTGAVSYTNGVVIAGGTSTHGITSTGANGGSGVKFVGTGAGYGLWALAGATSAFHGIMADGNAGNGSSGIYAVGAGTGSGLYAIGGPASNSNGIEGQGVGTGDGMHVTGGTGTSGHGLHAEAGTTGAGIYAQGTGTGRYGIEAVGVGASDSGGFKAYATTDGDGIEMAAAGANRHGFFVTGGTGTGKGIFVDDVEVTGTTLLTGVVTATAGITANTTGNLTGSVGSVTGLTAADVGAIKTKTDFLPSVTAGAAGGVFIAGTNAATSITTALTTTFTGNLTGSVGSVASGGIAAASFAAGAITAAAIADAAIDNATFAADVGSTAIATNVIGIAAKKGVVDALNVDTYTEPGQEAPAVTSTLVKKIGYLYKFLRNKKTQTATTLSVFDDAGTTVDQKATVSDDATTYTHGEIGTGP